MQSGKDVKSFARGTRKLLSAQRQNQEHLFDRLVRPIYTELAAILGHSAFQAGCHKFEIHLPVPDAQEIRSQKERH
jgi:hypothetical protein